MYKDVQLDTTYDITVDLRGNPDFMSKGITDPRNDSLLEGTVGEGANRDDFSRWNGFQSSGRVHWVLVTD